MSDESPSELSQLNGIADWLDGLYLRLQSADLVLSTEGVRADEYCENLQSDLDAAAQTGVAVGRSMEHCALLFEQLAFGTLPGDSVARARAEINLLAVAVRQLAIQSQQGSPQAVSWADHCEEMKARGLTHAATAASWLADHPEDNRTIEEVIKASKNYRVKRNRERKSSENPT